MSEADEMKQLEARIAKLEAMNANRTIELNTESMVSFPQFDVGMPPIVPIGGSGGMFEWDAKKRRIGKGGVMIGRKWFAVEESSEGLSDNSYCLEVTLGETPSVSLVQQDIPPPDPNGDTSWIPLYRIEDGNVKDDWRGCFVVPAYE